MLARQPQARLWNRTNSNFPKTQGPVARKKSQKATQILRAGNFLPTPRGNPRKWGSGESSPMDLGGAKRSRSPSAASPVAFCLLFRHGKRRSPPAGGEISRVQRTQSEPCPLIRPFGPPSPRGEGFLGGAPFIRPLRGHLPPEGKAFGGRLKKETNHSKVRNPLWNSPPWRATAP